MNKAQFKAAKQAIRWHDFLHGLDLDTAETGRATYTVDRTVLALARNQFVRQKSDPLTKEELKAHVFFGMGPRKIAGPVGTLP